MMRLIAFLRDSYREAVSGWMLQVMLLFAGVVVLFLAGISLRPMALDDQLRLMLKGLSQTLRFQPGYADMGSPEFTARNVKASNPAEPWKSDYAFEVVVGTASPEARAKFKEGVRAAGTPASRAGVKTLIQATFPNLENVEVASVPAEEVAPSEVVYAVTSRGTSSKDVTEWRHEPSLFFFYDVPFLMMSPREYIYLIEKWLINGAGAWLLLAVSVVVTAGFVPNMLGKGTIDLLVSKPVSKPFVLLAKYLGGLTFVALITTIAVLGVWAVLGLRTGIWSPNFLLTVPILTFYFAVLYAVSTLAAVLTRNSLVAILATLLAWSVFWAVGKVNDGVQNRYDAEAKQAQRTDGAEADDDDEPENPFAPKKPKAGIDPDAPLWLVLPKWAFPVVRVVHLVTPRTYQIDASLARTIAAGVLSEREMKQQGYGKPPRESWPEMIGVSLAFVALCLSLACARMVTRDG